MSDVFEGLPRGVFKCSDDVISHTENEFLRLAENLPLNIARWDTEGRYLYINPVHEQTLGKPAHAVIGTLIPDSHTHVKPTIARVVASGESVLFAKQLLKEADGVTHIHEVSVVPERDAGGKIVSVLGIGRDMTAFYQAQEIIVAQEQKFRSLVESTPDFICSFDCAGRIRYMNNLLAKRFSLARPDELVGKSPGEQWTDGRYLYIEQAIARVVQSGQEEIIEHHDFNDKIRQYETRFVPERDISGKLVGVISIGRDITERKNAEHQLQHIVTNLPGFVYSLRRSPDGSLSVPYASPGIEKLCGLRPEDVLNDMTLLKLRVHPGDLLRLKASFVESARTMTQRHVEFRICRPDRPARWVETRTLPFCAADGSLLWHGIMLDIDERKRMEEALRQHKQHLVYLAHHDVLTGLPNRILLADRIRQGIANAGRTGDILAVACLDLDNFKPINDMYGHEVGDQVLRKIAQRMGQTLRDSDTVARIGGDEFVLLLIGQTRKSETENTLRRLLQIISEPISIDDIRVSLTASIGISIFPDDDDDPDILLRRADQAMYIAKRSGRNQFVFSCLALQEKTRQCGPLAHELRKALEQGDITAHYQPIVDLASGRILKAEVLARWMHPERGLVSPAEFIPLAEETGLINAVGDCVFQLALPVAREWNLRCPPSGAEQALHRIGINRSPRQFFSGKGINDWTDLLLDAGVTGEMLCIEITEGLLLDDRPGVLTQLNQIHAMGITLSLDDFGTGYSALSYLKKFRIDSLKIDRSFVMDIVEDDSDRAIVESIIAMANRLGIKTIAEGVETVEQARLLTCAGCDMAQGFLYARPMPAQAFLDFVAEREAVQGRFSLL